MKTVLFAIALMAGSQAFAARDCNPYIVTPNGDSGESYYYSPCGAGAPITYHSCKEGEVAYTTEYVGGEPQDVRVVCKNGSFAPKAAPVKYTSCREGEIAYSTDYVSGEPQDYAIVCRRGTFVRLNQ